MKIETYPIFTKLLNSQLIGATVIVVDVLRSSTSIIWALKNGAEKLIPTKNASEAAMLASRLRLQDCLVAGEIKGVKVQGFDVGNSPGEFTRIRVLGKTIIFGTTNGTGTICGCVTAKNLLIGAMINASAVAKRAAELGNDVIIMCAGTEGAVSADDLCAAGAIANAIAAHSNVPVESSDMTLVCRMIYSDWLDGRADLKQTKHYSTLLELGFGEDIRLCFGVDTADVVPEYVNDAIRG